MYPLYNTLRPSEQNVTDFLAAAKEGDIDRLTGLLDTHGNALINKINSVGDTALILAAYHRNIHVVERLLKRGAEIDIKGLYGSTALHWAAGLGQWDITEMLLAHGANPSIRNEHGWTALDLARENGFPGLAKKIGELIEKKTDAAPKKISQEKISDEVQEQRLETLKKKSVKIIIKRNPQP